MRSPCRRPSTCRPAAASRAALPCAPTSGPGDGRDRPPADVGEPQGRPPLPCRATTGARSTGRPIAHTGELMVRELEAGRRADDRHGRPARRTATRPSGSRAGPRHRRRPARRGTPVLLGTIEASGPVLARSPTGGRRSPAGPGRRTGRRATPAAELERPAMSLLEAVRRANRPGAPEHSIRLRVACPGAVLVAIAACAALGEIAGPRPWAPWSSCRPGMAFSLSHPGPTAGLGQGRGGPRRHRSPASGSSTRSAPRRPASRRSRNPLTVLFVCILVVHSFHVPSRRDLLFSLGSLGRPDGGGGGPGHRPPLRPLRRGLGRLRPLGPDRDVGLGQRRGPHLDGGARAGAGGDLGRGGGRLPRPPGARSWRSRINFLARAGAGGSVGVPGGLAGDAGGAGPARPGRQSGRPDPCRRLPRLRHQPGHGAAGQPGQHRGDAGAGPAPVVLGGGDLRHLGRPELVGVQPVPRRPFRESHRSSFPIPEGDVPFGQSDLQTFYVSSSTADLVFHAESATEVWFPAGKSTSPTTAPSCRRIGLGTGSDLHRRVAGEHRHARRSCGPTAIPRLSPVRPCGWRTQLPHPYPRVQALAQSVTARRHQHLRQGAVPHRLDRRPHPLLDRHPAAAARRRHRRRVPLRQPGRVLRADLDVPGRDAALARHPRPRGGGLRARALQPDHRPLPGSGQRRPRLGPGVVPRLRLAELRPDGGRAGHPPSPGATALHDVGSALGRIPPAPVATSSRRPVWSSSSCAGGERGPRRGRSGWRAMPSAPDDGPAGPAGPPRPWLHTPPGSTVRARPRTPPGAGWPRRWRRASTGASTRTRTRNARWSRRPSGPRSCAAAPARPRCPTGRSRESEDVPVTPGQFPRRSVPFSSCSGPPRRSVAIG